LSSAAAMRSCIALSLLVACKTPSTGDARPAPAAEATDPAEEPAPAAPSAEAAPAPRVVLVTIDGARWQDVFGGGDPALADDGLLGAWGDPINLLPRLHGLAASGVAFGGDAEGCGNVRAHGTSNLSLPGYLEILGGRTTRCHWNGCGRTDLPSILDDADRGGIPSASIASWEVLERAASDGTSGVFVAAGARAWSPLPPPQGKLETMLASASRLGPSPGPSRTAYRPDSATRAIALEYLRSATPRLLHVGLGDTDEWAHRGNYVGYLRALHEADAFVGEIIDALQEQGTRDATTILVTTDHGRGRDFREHGPSRPESGRVFLFAAGPRVAEPGTRCASRDIELPDVGATIRRLLDLPKDESARAGKPIAEIAGPSDGT
jgi:hypothetical protein